MLVSGKSCYPVQHAGDLAQVSDVDAPVVKTVGQGHSVHGGRALHIEQHVRQWNLTIIG